MAVEFRALEPPHPSVYIVEEMETRGWSRDLLAWLMVLGASTLEGAWAALAAGDYAEQSKQWQITRLALDMYFEVGPTMSNMRMGDMAQRFSLAFGASESLFSNLETAWLKSQSHGNGVAHG